jgi:hypothetical protein
MNEIDDWLTRSSARNLRAQKAAELKLDVTGRPIKIGDTVAYAVSLGRSAGMQIATVHAINDKGHFRLKIDERFRKTYGSKDIVTVQYSDRMVVLGSLDI